MIPGVIGIVISLLLITVGLPIAISLMLTACFGTTCLIGWDRTITMLGMTCFDYLSYGFAVIPMFVFMGYLGYYSGLLTEVFEVARRWLGGLPGGLAISVVAADSAFAACSGSSVAACTVIGQSSIPVMRKAGYSDAMSVGVVGASGTLAALIPPSTTICIYGLLVDESIGKLLIAGIIPGIVSAIIYVVFIVIRSRGVPHVEERFTWQSRLYSIRYLWVMVVIVIAIIGGIYFGVCTPTEGGGVGAFVVLVLAIVTRKIDWGVFWKTIKATCVTTGMVLIIIVAAVIFSRFLILTGFSDSLTGTVAALVVPRWTIFMLITLVYFILGCFIGAIGMMIMTLPIFYPLMLTLGFDSIWFGIIVVKYCEMAFITPPVGINLYAVKSVAPDVPLGTIIRGCSPFLLMDLFTIGVFYIFPQIVTFLPSLM